MNDSRPEMSAVSDAADSLLGQLADEFLEAHECGSALNVEDLAAQYPELADVIRQTFPAMLALRSTEALPRASMELPVEDLSDFRLIRELGRGGMGVVYEALQRSLGRRVALKVLPLAGMLDERRLRRFHNEAHAAAALQHPHIVPVFGVGCERGVHYYAMQLIHGVSLAEVLQRLNAAGAATVENDASTDRYGLLSSRTTRPSDRFRAISQLGIQAAEALAYAHREGVIHRDIKPSNLLLEDNGKLWVADFGLARMQTDGELTLTGDQLGTLRYMSPEQLTDHKVVDQRTDVYSLGLTLYEVLSGHAPFGDVPREHLAHKILTEDPRPLRKTDPSMAVDLETIILKAIAKDRDARYQTAEALAEDLRRFVDRKSILARPTSRVAKTWRRCRRNPLVAGLCGSTVASLVVAVVILALSNIRIRQESGAKDAALASARQAVDQMLVRVGSDRLAEVTMSQPLRKALLGDALKFYEEFLAQADDNAALREQMATLLDVLSDLQRKSGEFDQARASVEKAITLMESLIIEHPEEPRYRFLLGIFEQGLAYTWHVTPPGPNYDEVEAHSRKGLKVLTALEEDWPERRQPVTSCLKLLGDVAFKRGDREEAERLWRECLVRGEAYLDQLPNDGDQWSRLSWAGHRRTRADELRSQLGWTCADLGQLLSTPPDDRHAEAEKVFRIGLRHASMLFDGAPSSEQGRDVAASLNVRLAVLLCGTERTDEAAPMFEQGLEHIRFLCALNPWNRGYWVTARYLHEQAVNALQSKSHNDEAQRVARGMYRWFEQSAPKIPEEPIPQSEFRLSRTQLVQILRNTNLTREADEVAHSIDELR